MTDEVQWRGKTLRIVAVETDTIKCERCACQGPCFDNWLNAPLDDRGVGLECMQPRAFGHLHHWEVQP